MIIARLFFVIFVCAIAPSSGWSFALGEKGASPFVGGAPPTLPSEYHWFDLQSSPRTSVVGNETAALVSFYENFAFKEGLEGSKSADVLCCGANIGEYSFRTYTTPKYPGAFALVTISKKESIPVYHIFRVVEDRLYTAHVTPQLMGRWKGTNDNHKLIKYYLRNKRFENGAFLIQTREDLNVLLGVVYSLPSGFSAEFVLRPLVSHPNPKMAAFAKDRPQDLSAGLWMLDVSREGYQRARLNSVNDTSERRLSLTVVCNGSDFYLVVGKTPGAPKYFDFADWNSKGIPVTGVSFQFSNKSMERMLWQISEYDSGDIYSPTKFVANLSGSMKIEMMLRGLPPLGTDWDTRAFLRRIVSSEGIVFSASGIPKKNYTAVFIPKADIGVLAKHLPCY